MESKKTRIVLSFVFLTAYLVLVFMILHHELSGGAEAHDHPDSMMGELKILIGVLTAGVGQILHYWFGPGGGPSSPESGGGSQSHEPGGGSSPPDAG